MFKEIKYRDAWSTIRGFVYQVDVTILKWIELDTNQIIELEKGEDIDIVHRNLKNEEISRELEQLKYRESSISLNQLEILEILLNFFIHKRNNLKKDLCFRFVTNTSYTNERPAIFPDGKKNGITAWIKLSNSKVIDSNNDDFIKIKTHLLKKIKEIILSLQEKIEDGNNEKYSKKILDWNNFKNFISKDENLKDYIKSFEWSLSFNGHEDISETIKTTLLEKDLVENNKTANLAYSKLFLYVFKILGKRNSKQLNRSELISQIEVTILSKEDKRFLDNIARILSNIKDRLNQHDEKINLNSDKIATLTDHVNLISKDTTFNYKLKSISFSRPSLIKNGSERRLKINNLKNLFRSHTWINIQGINGTGKSQLASQYCSKVKSYWWLDLRPYNNESSKYIILIETFLSVISNINILNDKVRWMDDVVNTIPKNSLIVINDLPNLLDNEEAIQLLILISNTFQKKGIKLLSTSNYNIPKKLLRSINLDSFYEFYDLDFSNDELVEFLVNSGADKSISNYINLISILSNRNASLIGAIIYHLKTINWGKNSDLVIEVLLKKEFSKDIVEDAQQGIKRFIHDQDSRELLYRLSLIEWSYKKREVIAIAEIEKSINHPNEKFLDLINVWIQKINDDSFQTSPLIYQLGKDNLPESVIQNIHLSLAKLILSDKKLDQILASRCISEFIKGKDYNNAGFVLLELYRSSISKEDITIINEWGFLNYWDKTEIPKQMEIVLRVYIRVEQIRLNRELGKETKYLHEDIESFFKEPIVSISQKILLHIICVSLYESGYIKNTWLHVEEILTNWNKLEEPYNDVIDLKILKSLLWIVSDQIENETEIKKWFELTSLFEKNFKVDVFQDEMAQITVSLIGNRIVNRDNCNSRDTISSLTLLAKHFNKLKNEVLEATILREIIHIKFEKNEEEALDFSTKLIKGYSSDEAKYLIYDNMGKLLYDKNRHIKSIPWLQKAIKLDCNDQINFTDTLIYLACAFSKCNTVEAVKYCEIAIEVADKRDNFLDLEYIQLLSELGIAYWLNDQYEESFETFENAILLLFKNKENEFNKNWIRLFSWLGHSLGYIAPTISRSKVPNVLKDENQYVKPYQGIFTFNTRDLSDFYDIKKDSLIYAHLAVFSEGINNISKAYYWSLKAFDLARKSGGQQILMVSSVCSHYSLIEFKVDEAFETFLLFSVVSSHLSGSIKERREQLKNIDIKAIYNSKPSEKWNIAEDTTLTFVGLPLFIKIIMFHINNDMDKEKFTSKFFITLKNYKENASDPDIWFHMIEICSRIINDDITERELIELGNNFDRESRNNLFMICILGVIYLSKSSKLIITETINILPYLIKLFENSSESIITFILVPFVKNRAIYALKNEFIGSKHDLDSILEKIEVLQSNNKDTIQKILQPIVIELDLNIPADRKSWLYGE
ncbi:tetratricopeptide repeat protein [Zunongwangia profunda]|uniref:tetratricopeptide repeat protein n=1 Tax=Zunongwangia profunda TaxID=398743 RepID=UPI001D183E93|nr:hypothetical protein [Zunongwangia profunda]MCC4229649.1 hypothetical protein [Zunongwangia profunda]